MRWRSIGAAAALLVGVLSLGGFGGSEALSAGAAPACASEVTPKVLPRWARAGFSGSDPRIPYELGRNGGIAAIVFGYPLLSPPAKERANKILWVERRLSR